jgi:DNA-binding GntR family transcriptional regulator
MKTAERIYLTLKQEIQNHELKPGASISIVEIAKRLHTSPTPVREALSRLEQEGLIISKNGKKVVFVLTVKEVNQIFDIKKALESSIASLAVERGKDAQFKELKKVISNMEAFLEKIREESPETTTVLNSWLTLDREFHDLLYRMADNQKAKEMVALLNLQWHRFRLALLSLPGMLKKSVEEHIGIGKAIVSQDSQQCVHLMSMHLEQVRKSLLNVISLFSPISN